MMVGIKTIFLIKRMMTMKVLNYVDQYCCLSSPLVKSVQKQKQHTQKQHLQIQTTSTNSNNIYKNDKITLMILIMN